MSFESEMKKLFKNKQLCMILAILVFLGLVLFVYNNQKSKEHSGMYGGENHAMLHSEDQHKKDSQHSTEHHANTKHVDNHLGVKPAMPQGLNSGPQGVSGGSSVTGGVPQSCMNQQLSNPSDLLPHDSNSEFASHHPQGSGELHNVSLLKAGQLSGIDTVGGTLRNANLQLRSEPPNPRAQVSPWLNSTIEPDLMRVPLELGCGSQ